MSIGPFDVNAGDYGKVDYVDPFGDTTADIAPVAQKAVAPVAPKTIAPVVPAAPVAQKPVQGNVGISPITMQGAVSIPAESNTLAQPAYPTTEDGQLIIGKYQSNVYSGNGKLKHKKGDPILKPAGYMTPEQRALLPQTDEQGNKIYYTETGDLKSKLYTDFRNLKEQADKEAPPVTRYIRNNQESYTDSSESRKLLIPRTLEYLEQNNIPLVNEQGKILVTPVTTELIRQYAGDDAANYYKSTGEYGTYSGVIDTPKQSTFGKIWGTAVTALGAIAGGPAGAAAASAAVSASQGGDLKDMVKAAGTAYITAGAAKGSGLFGNVGSTVAPMSSSAVQGGISAGTAAGVSTAVQGGDLGDVVKNGMLGGIGGYVSGLGTDAAALEQAAQAAGAAGDFSSSVALTMQANQLTQQAGLIGTIANSAKAIDAAIDGDYVSAITSGLNAAGTDLTKFTSDKITGLFGEEALVNLNVDDIAAGVNKVATSLLDGKDFDNALQAGVKEYVQKGGSLGGAGDKIKDYLTAAGEGLYNDILKPAGDFLTGLVDNVQSFDTPDSIKAIEDNLKQAGSALDDATFQKLKEGAENIYEPLETPEGVKAIEDAAQTAGSAIDDTVIQPIREGLKDIDLPDVDVDLDFPSFDVGSFLMEGLQPSQTAGRELLDPVYADLSNRRLAPVSQEELFAEPDYLQKLLRTL